MSWQAQSGTLVSRIQRTLTKIELHYDHHDHTIHGRLDNMEMLTRQEFEELVILWRKYYEIVPPDHVEKCNEAIRNRFSDMAIDRAQNRSGYVYLAYSETGHYKIGVSKNPEKRIGIFDTKMPVTVELLHDRFSEKRHEGEWFNLDGDDVAFVRQFSTFTNGAFETGELT